MFQHFSKIQDLQEDVLREKAKQDDVVRKLERTKMEADHLGEKEMLAREELEKERVSIGYPLDEVFECKSTGTIW